MENEIKNSASGDDSEETGQNKTPMTHIHIDQDIERQESGKAVGLEVGKIEHVAELHYHEAAPTSPPKPVEWPLFYKLPPIPRHLIGRDDLLDKIVSELQSGQPTLSIEGLAGVGKTSLAAAIVNHPAVRAHFKDGILWGNLGPKPDVASEQAGWAEKLGLDISQLLDAEDRRNAIKDELEDKCVLLVIDDAWQLEAAEMLKCGGPNCSHMLTTRDKAIARAFGGSNQSQTVPVLEEDPAFALLQTLAPEACDVDPQAAKDLAHAIGGLPLALNLVGSFLAEPERSFFPELSKDAFLEIADPRRRLELATKRLDSSKGQLISLEETLSLSLEDLPNEAQNAFYALGAFAAKPDRFSLNAALAVTETEPKILALLISRNLIERENNKLILHQVLADIARSEKSEGAIARHQQYYLDLVIEDLEDWQGIEQVYGQIKWAWNSLPEEMRFDYIAALRLFQIRRGLWQDQIDWIELGLQFAQTKGLQMEISNLLHNLGMVYSDLGQPQKALDYYQQSLAISEEINDREGTAITLSNIGLVYNTIGQVQDALAHFNQALVIHEDMGNRSGIATILNNISLVHQKSGKPQEALQYLNQALPFYSEIGDYDGVATALNNIAMVHRGLGELQEALTFYNKALPIFEKIGNRFGKATALNNIGHVYHGLGELQEALVNFNKALPIFEEIGYRSGVGLALNNIAMVNLGISDLQKALEYLTQALPIHEEIGNRDGMALALNNTGIVYQRLGKFQEALGYFYQALPIFEEIDNKDGMAMTLNNIGETHRQLVQLENANAFFNQALPLYEEIGNRDGMATTLNNIGLVYLGSGNLQEALTYFNQTLPIFEEIGNRNGVALALNNIGETHRQLGQPQEALAYYNQALPILEEIGDKYSIRILRYNITIILRAEGRLHEALGHLNQIVQLDLELEHPDLANDQALLSIVEAESAEQQKNRQS